MRGCSLGGKEAFCMGTCDNTVITVDINCNRTDWKTMELEAVQE